jgi:hypothetical protein
MYIYLIINCIDLPYFTFYKIELLLQKQYTRGLFHFETHI